MIPCPRPAPILDRGPTEPDSRSILASKPWDEIRGESGRIRPGYAWIEPLVAEDSGGRIWRDLAAPADGGVQLDRLPLVISMQDWTSLERGLCQRAALLDRLLQDVYGPQESIQSGWLPAGVVYADPRFRRSAHGRTGTPGPLLRFQATDLIRNPDGIWTVVADRTGIPGGLGLALMGLVESARALRGVLDGLGTHAALGFAAALSGAWDTGTGPGRALLVPEGTHDEADLGWMARGVSWGVVDDADLRVRGDHLHRRTPSGLERIELLIQARHRNGDGSVGATRDPRRIDLSDSVTHATLQRINPPGVDLVESPAWTPFLPRLCQHLLGEDLRLRSFPTWWCGDRQSLRQVEDNLGRLEVESVHAGRAAFLGPRQPIRSDDEVRIRRHINLRPECWVAREPIQPAHAPWSTSDGPLGQPTVLRLFTVATSTGWQVLPGGLAHVYGPGSMRDPAHSGTPPVKTVWIDTGTGPGGASTPETRTRLPRPRREPLLSLGMADRLVRLGRTWSRCDHGCRCIEAILVRSRDGVTLVRDPVVRILSTHLLRNLGLHGEDPLGERGSGAGLREARPTTGIPPDWFQTLCDPLIDQIGPCQPHLPPGLRDRVERLRRRLHQILESTGREGLEDLSVLLEGLRGLLLTGFDEDDAGRFLALGWHWDQTLHAGTLLMDLLSRPSHPLPGLGWAVDSILGIGTSRPHWSVFAGVDGGGVVDRVWDPTEPGSLRQRLIRVRDALDQVQGHSPGLFLNRSRQGLTEAVIEAERAGNDPLGAFSCTEEVLRRIVIRIRRAHEHFCEDFNDLPH